MTASKRQGEKSSSMEEQLNKEKEYNIFRDSLLRYLGYANEIGESFRYQYPKLVIPSYVIAFGYCCADAATSGHSAFDSAIQKGLPSPYASATVSTLDTLIWQTLASVTIPGATINMIVRASRLAMKKSPLVLPAMVVTWFPTAVGLGSIPLIIHPIDRSVDYVMDSAFRTIDWEQYFTTSSQKDESKQLSRQNIEEQAK